jgi:hypothetical protein
MNKKITLIGPKFIIESLAELCRDEPYEFRLLSNPNWNKMKLLDRVRYLGSSDLVHFLWGQRKLFIFLWAKISGIKIINHYIGTDVLVLLNEIPSKKFKAYLCNLLADKIFCVSPNLQNELKLIDIQAKLFPIAFKQYPDKIPKLPQNLNVFTYIPDGLEELYGWPSVEQLVQDYPDMQFFILANSGKNLNHYLNVKFLGWQENTEKWIHESYIHLRLTKHDGLPKTILEALAYGRQVIYSEEFPYCYSAKNFPELKERFDKLISQPKLNIDGAKYVRNEYHPVKIKQAIVNLYNELLR